MINTRLLKAALVENGYSQKSLSEKMRMSKNTLNSRINGKSKLSTEEVKDMCRILSIPQDKMIEIFFA